MGNVYCVDSSDEVKSNCLGQAPTGVAKGVIWSHESLGSSAVQGNHEMYARGMDFFDTFLPLLGMGVNRSLAVRAQATLRSKKRAIIILDTGATIPTLSSAPPTTGINTQTCGGALDWLRFDLRASKRERATRAAEF